MDLQSFCVGSRRKVHSFPFLRSAVQSTENMSKSFQFGVPVNGPTIEENCLKKMPDISCNAQFTFEELTKNQDCHSKKSCFDHLNKLSHFTFSRVVGGFVGSKSQGGSASREPHQVWDVIFRQLVDTACQATMNNNAQPYFSIGEAVSQSIFGQFNNRNNSTLDFPSFLFARSCDLFENKKSRTMASSSDAHCQDSGVSATAGDAQSREIKGQNIDMRKTDAQQVACKQSYADVAKAFVASRSDSVNKSERQQMNPFMPLPRKRINSMHRNSRKGNDMKNKNTNRLNGSCYSQPSYNISSQNPHKRSTTMHDRYEEHIPSKFARDKSSHTRHFKSENSSFGKMRTKDVNNTQPVIPSKDSKGHEEKRRRNNKFRNPNVREKERKDIGHRMQEDVAFACNVPEQFCQNWRCDHNRMSRAHSGRTEFGNQRRDFKPKTSKQQTRLHSPPPRTLVSDCVKPEGNHLKKKIDTPKVGNMHEEMLCNREKSVVCRSVDLPRSGEERSESSFSCSLTALPVLPQRVRVSSECSVDSEDSVVFERGEHDLDETESDDETDSDSGSEYSSAPECDSDAEDCEEVDFCYIIPAEDINAKITDSTFTQVDVFCPVADRLKDINARWHKENDCLPKVDKVPRKVHFPCTEELSKVHPMVHWLFAYREARRGPWEEIGRDRCRFQSRIQRADQELSHVLTPEHRRKIWEERMCDVGNT